MFNVGGPEFVVILLVALIVLGPDQLPKAMRTFGSVMGEIRKVSSGFQDEMKKAMDTIDVKGMVNDDKPMSPKPPSGQPGDEGSPATAPVDEVVARNTDTPVTAADEAAEPTPVSPAGTIPGDVPAPGADAPVAEATAVPAADAEPAPPTISAADRAAG